MTEASAGLRKALARNAGVSKLSNDELLASLTDEQKASLAASLAPAAKADAMEPEGEEEMEDGKKKPKSKKKDDEYMEDKESAAKAATDRALAVMASEHFAGREKLAANLLAVDSMSADQIVTALAAAPKAAAPAAAAATADDDAAAREQMRQNLAAEQPAPTGQAADDTAEPQADNSLVANMKARHGLKD